MVASYEYDAWGNHKVCNSDGSENNDPNFIGNLNPFRYRGYYYDTDVKLYYLQTRWYDPEVGRFINLDQISYLDPETVNGLNLYAYCGNNPVMGYDPEGTSLFLTLLLGFLIGAAISGISEIADQVEENGLDASKWDWKQIGKSTLGGGVTGLISSIPVANPGLVFLLGGVGSVAGGLISGSVTDVASGAQALLVGGTANLIGYGVAKLYQNYRVSRIMELGPKAKSCAIWSVNGVDPSTIDKTTRNVFSQISAEEVTKIIQRTSILLKNNGLSSLISSLMPEVFGI